MQSQQYPQETLLQSSPNGKNKNKILKTTVKRTPAPTPGISTQWKPVQKNANLGSKEI